MPKDCIGRELKIGDVVSHANGCRGYCHNVGVVTEIKKSRVYFEVPFLDYEERDKEKWPRREYPKYVAYKAEGYEEYRQAYTDVRDSNEVVYKKYISERKYLGVAYRDGYYSQTGETLVILGLTKEELTGIVTP